MRFLLNKMIKDNLLIKGKKEKSEIFHRRFFIKNRKGDKIISIYWFSILFIVAAAIVYMVASFYGEPYDVREVEANILTNQITRCLTNAGYVSEGVFVGGFLSEGFKTNFRDNCHINFETEDVYGWKDTEQFYVELGFFDFNSDTELGKIVEGNINLKDGCLMNGKNSPSCIDRDFYVIDEENNQYKINVVSVVRKTEKNVQ